jgi:hypothetical protein
MTMVTEDGRVLSYSIIEGIMGPGDDWRHCKACPCLFISTMSPNGKCPKCGEAGDELPKADA